MSRATSSTATPHWIRAAAVFCALAVWLIGILGASSRLHAAVHADADHADHLCAVTLFNHGVDETPVEVSLGAAPLEFVEELKVGSLVAPKVTLLYREPPGRGPPLR